MVWHSRVGGPGTAFATGQPVRALTRTAGGQGAAARRDERVDAAPRGVTAPPPPRARPELDPSVVARWWRPVAAAVSPTSRGPRAAAGWAAPRLEPSRGLAPCHSPQVIDLGQVFQPRVVARGLINFSLQLGGSRRDAINPSRVVEHAKGVYTNTPKECLICVLGVSRRHAQPQNGVFCAGEYFDDVSVNSWGICG